MGSGGSDSETVENGLGAGGSASGSTGGGTLDATAFGFGRAAAGSPGRTVDVVTTWVVAGSIHSPWSERLA